MAKRTILAGLILVLLGVIAPLLMVLHVIQPSFWLSIASYCASVAGLFLGVAGAAQVNIGRRRV